MTGSVECVTYTKMKLKHSDPYATMIKSYNDPCASITVERLDN